MDAFGILRSRVEACQAEGSLDPRPSADAASLILWSLVHGLARLEREGLIAGMVEGAGGDAGMAKEALVDAMRCILKENRDKGRPTKRP
ncbi:MAG: WHG domain-containing protein [Spirochaetales bacterium]|nr:MAG: WHG domain-containing protein [Spirochaetales bacterium]